MYKLIEFLTTMATSFKDENNCYDADSEVLTKKHANYFKRFLYLLPPRLASHDSTRVTIAFFAVCGLDILDSLDLLSEQMKLQVANWVYSHQVVPSNDSTIKCGGFQGSSTLNTKTTNPNCGTIEYRWGHLAMTYTGLAILITLGDDLSKVDRKAIVEGVAAVQRPDGSFSASIEGNEHDMRFVYCAAAICSMLNDWGTVDKKSMAKYIQDSLRYDYGVSQHFEMESHGGTTFCAIAALQLSDQLDILTPKTIEKIKRWLVFRQDGGFNGRPNKQIDTCYSFWIGATLKILNAFHLTNFEENRRYILETQNNIVGGFSKWPQSTTDPFHTYFALCGLSFINEPGLLEIQPSLNISMRAFTKLKTLHKLWQLNDDLNHVRLEID